jgi:hypothetical protein
LLWHRVFPPILHRRYPVGAQSGSGARFDMLRPLDSLYRLGKPEEEIKWLSDVIGRFASRVVPPRLFSTKKSPRDLLNSVSVSSATI